MNLPTLETINLAAALPLLILVGWGCVVLLVDLFIPVGRKYWTAWLSVLGLIGTEKRMEYTAMGDSVNTAKRIQENARAGEILISAPVFNLVAQHIEARPIEPLTAKGKSLPVIVYKVFGLKGAG